MSSPLCNPKFVEHLKQSKDKTKLRMHLKADRIIDRVYSQVLADLHLFFTFDDGRVTPREVQSGGEPSVLSPCTTQQHLIQSLNLTPLDVNTVLNVSQNGDRRFYEFQASIAQSHFPTTNKSPNLSEPINSYPIHQITQHDNDMDNSLSLVFSNEQEVKQKFDKEITVQSNEVVNEGISNEPILTDLKQLVDIKPDQSDEEECECDECVYGGIEVKDEDDDDSDGVQWIDDDYQEDGESSLKRPKMNSTHPNNAQPEVARQSSGQSTDEAQANECERPEDDQIESVKSQVSGIQSTIEHYDHGLYNFDESLVIQQNQTYTDNAIEGHITTACTTIPTQPNNTKSLLHFQCPQCPKSFDRPYRLEQHVRVHTGERPFACDQCDKRFTHKCSLEVHLRTHSGERPYKCRFCEQCFADWTTRKRHEQAKHHHVKPYRCKVCGLTVTTRSTIITHIRIVHFGLPPTLKEQRERNIIDERDPRDLVEKVEHIV